MSGTPSSCFVLGSHRPGHSLLKEYCVHMGLELKPGTLRALASDMERNPYKP